MTVKSLEEWFGVKLGIILDHEEYPNADCLGCGGKGTLNREKYWENGGAECSLTYDFSYCDCGYQRKEDGWSTDDF